MFSLFRLTHYYLSNTHIHSEGETTTTTATTTTTKKDNHNHDSTYDHMNHHNRAIFPNRPVVDWPQGKITVNLLFAVVFHNVVSILWLHVTLPQAVPFHFTPFIFNYFF